MPKRSPAEIEFAVIRPGQSPGDEPNLKGGAVCLVDPSGNPERKLKLRKAPTTQIPTEERPEGKPVTIEMLRLKHQCHPELISRS